MNFCGLEVGDRLVFKIQTPSMLIFRKKNNSGNNDKNDICGLTCAHEMFIFISFVKEKIGSYV